ncbi:hypothetical protein GCM10009720_10820 [Yaniella flava]|uniref:N-acetyltransferase domain-containing protein n=1 Tax=Yaniella flava TaxID=287930 RepID=A0ABN2UA28_9MICC|nr:N-acetyltransferase [Micrococcaceae bacterium]
MTSTDNPKFIHHDGYIGMMVDDSETLAAHEVYKDHQAADGTKQRAFVSTVVDENYRGAGLAGKLVKYSLDDALERGFRIIAICPYVKNWIEKQDDPRYAQASDTPRPEHFE